MPKGRAGSVPAAADPITQFFAALDEPGHLATFEGESAQVRFDVVDGKQAERWHVSITRGDVAVSHSSGPAEAHSSGPAEAHSSGPADAHSSGPAEAHSSGPAEAHSSGPADVAVRIDRRHLEALVTGRLNAQAAFLRGLFTCEGSPGALMMFQRCLPGPPGSTGRMAPIPSKTVMAGRGLK